MKSLFKKRLNYQELLPVILVIIVCIFSFIFSICESKLSIDSHHWGLQYSSAVDILKGMQLYKESLNSYGILSSLIQLVSIVLLGNTIVSIGIITGLFYSINILISYFIFKRFLNHWLSCLAAIIIFLIMPAIIYPWPNYIAYTFTLLSVLFLTSSQIESYKYVLSGLSLSFSLLSRHTNILSAFPAIYLYLILSLFLFKEDCNISAKKRFLYFSLGFLTPLLIFAIYLIATSSYALWFEQTFKVYTAAWFKYIAPGLEPKISNYWLFFKYLLTNIFQSLTGSDFRLKLYSIIFFNNLLILTITTLKLFKTKPVLKIDLTLLLFCLVSIFGYLEALQTYELLRLQNSSSLGVGVLIYSIFIISQMIPRPHFRSVVLWIAIASLITQLVLNFQFTSTFPKYKPWRLNQLALSGLLREPKNVEILTGKLFEEETAKYYEEIVQVLDSYSCQLNSVVNLTINSFIPYLSKEYSRVQIAPFYFQGLSQDFLESERQKYGKVLDSKQAILLVSENKVARFNSVNEIPKDYKIIKAIDKTIRSPDQHLKIAIPDTIINTCP